MRLAAKRRIATWHPCTRCHRSLPVSAYGSNGVKGRRPSCRDCESDRDRARRAKRSDQRKITQAQWRARNIDALREANRLWREENPDYYARNIERMRAQGRTKAARRRARQRAVENEPINARIVFERSFGICGICGHAVDLDNFQVDHIVPLALGGAHVYENVQASHPVCNQRKGART